MIGIYQDSFVDYLKDNFDDNVKITSKNIIIPCCWCEYPKEKDHYHLYISLEAPIFHCFHAGCERGGTLRKLLKKIEGHDISNSFIDKIKLKEFEQKKEVFVDKTQKSRHVYIPALKPEVFPNKDLYIKKRLKFHNLPTKNIHGLIYDVYDFIQKNRIPVDETLFRLQEYLHSNFVGFLTNYGTTVMFRNIDESHSMKFFKLKLNSTPFLDYYRLPGDNSNSQKIVLAEGIFDIFSSYLFDHLNIKNDVKLYASALSSKFTSLLHSIVFHEQVFRPSVIILSDNGIPKNDYKKMKKYNSHIIDTLTVYYNKGGKDFNDTPVIPLKCVI